MNATDALMDGNLHEVHAVGRLGRLGCQRCGDPWDRLYYTPLAFLCADCVQDVPPERAYEYTDC